MKPHRRRNANQRLSEQAALNALGLLTVKERQQLAGHLEAASAQDRAGVRGLYSVAARLGLAAKPVQPAAGLRARLMAQIGREASSEADASGGFVFHRTADMEWVEVAAGVAVKALFTDSASGRTTALVRMAPGSRYEPHRHVADEELYVVEGSCYCGGRYLQVGDYHRAPAGSVHIPTVSDDGCVMLVISSSHNEPIPER